MAGLIVSQRARIFHGHDWVYGTEVRKVYGNPEPGDVVAIKDQKDRFLGSAIYNPQSQIVARRFCRQRQDLDRDFFLRRLRQALDLRERSGINMNLCRVVSSEADALPGLIIDRYGPHVVVQLLTLAMDLRKEDILAAIDECLAPQTVVLRNDSASRLAEGMETYTEWVQGAPPAPFVAEHAGIKFLVDLPTGQKTGLYLDQLDNYLAVAPYARGRVVADTFCNQGGFALACALGGAKRVVAVDVSAEAIAAVKENAKLNGVEIETVEANAFDWLKQESLRGAESGFDMLILDPPSFTRNRKSLNDAMRGYKEIHLRAMKMLPKCGILSTFSCSHHASRELFWQNVVEAAVDARATPRLLCNHAQRLDHPVVATLPETEYLKGFTFEMMAGR